PYSWRLTASAPSAQPRLPTAIRSSSTPNSARSGFSASRSGKSRSNSRTEAPICERKNPVSGVKSLEVIDEKKTDKDMIAACCLANLENLSISGLLFLQQRNALLPNPCFLWRKSPFITLLLRHYCQTILRRWF